MFLAAGKKMIDEGILESRDECALNAKIDHSQLVQVQAVKGELLCSHLLTEPGLY
jgi:hypothetical protein